MIAELGLAALWMAAALALLQLLAGVLSTRGGDNEESAAFGALARPAAVVQGVLVLAAFACLAWCFVATDLSVALVASDSSADKPLIFRLASTWGNHEGSMLLWVAVMGLAGALVALLEHRLPERTMRMTLAAQAFVSLGFYAFLLLASNPFARLDPAPPAGMGLNPLLQDMGLAFHPPTLYLGYVGLSIAFSFAVGALASGEAGRAFAVAMRPWVLGAWIFLTLGITLGSYWAYYELGWGGWWFWDPVENASLMPWLAATALFHSVNVLASRDALRVWTVMLGVIAFSMSMIGTFLVRSGILTSVHAFAVDPTRGTFILGLLALYIGGALLLFALRAGRIHEGARFEPVSREGALVLNNVLLTAILAIVLFGTLYPLVAEAMGERVSVGPPYFNPVSALFAVPMLVVLMVGPLLRWRRDTLPRVLPLLTGAAIMIALAVIAVLVWGGASVLPFLVLVLGAGLAVASWMPLVSRRRLKAPLPLWGMVIAHFGIGVALIGMGCESTWTIERLVALKPGQSTQVGPWSVRLAAIEPQAGPNWTALEAELDARYRGGAPVHLQPQARMFWAPPQGTSETALHTRWNGQLYTVLGEQTDDGRWQLRLWWKPFVSLIWLGGVLVALGGLLALAGRVGSGWRRGRIVRRIEERREEMAR
ncbi:heme lyase CcmF/NrfE family subunit [Novosphingobium sp. 9]|uniref:heme lyase CcmF/NrfE family subunit n=1 Tax=Novosphingobium sp. 9 TaxID=2025349 RepID=UPI0021B63BA9|nr:heme lyase CcmF/NrfE family subunit [Novosphingobium sp. 9]